MLPLCRQGRFRRCEALLRIEMERDQIDEQLEHPNDLRSVQARRLRVDGAQSAKEVAAFEHDRDRDVALKSVAGGGAMRAVRFVSGYVVDHHGVKMLTNLVADGGLELEFVSWSEAERDLIPHGAGDPAFIGYTSYGRKPHPRSAAH